MKIVLFAVLILIGADLGRAQSNSGLTGPTVVTSTDGRKFMLYPDGTWSVISAAESNSTATSTPSQGPGGGNRPEDATFLFKAPKGNFGVWMNPDKWKQAGPADQSSIKTLFNHKSGDLYAMVIAERVSLTLQALKNAAIANAKRVASDLKVELEEPRQLNGKPVLLLKMTGTVQGSPFVYYGYYYGGKEGSLQVVTYTSSNLFDEYKNDMQEFLDGTQIGVGPQ
jgi:hypothetical protein